MRRCDVAPFVVRRGAAPWEAAASCFIVHGVDIVGGISGPARHDNREVGGPQRSLGALGNRCHDA